MAEKPAKKPLTTSSHAPAPVSEVKIDPRDVERRELENSLKAPAPAKQYAFRGIGVHCPTIDGQVRDVIFSASGAFSTADEKLAEWCRKKFEEVKE
jgi:hypothetical protein